MTLENKVHSLLESGTSFYERIRGTIEDLSKEIRKAVVEVQEVRKQFKKMREFDFVVHEDKDLKEALSSIKSRREQGNKDRFDVFIHRVETLPITIDVADCNLHFATNFKFPKENVPYMQVNAPNCIIFGGYFPYVEGRKAAIQGKDGIKATLVNSIFKNVDYNGHRVKNVIDLSD